MATAKTLHHENRRGHCNDNLGIYNIPDMKINICPICVIVSGIWLILSAGVAWGYLASEQFMIPIAILMGGSVVGIAYQGEKKFIWASTHSLIWKIIIIFSGMPAAYLFVINLSKPLVVTEFILLIIIAYFFFIKRLKQPGGLHTISQIEKQMEQCC